MTKLLPRRLQLIAGFAAVYLIWGSTYLFILFGIDTLPPLSVIGGVRFIVAGSILYLWSIGQGASKPNLLQWRDAAITGILLLVGGNGGVVLAEDKLPSGLAALIVATVPLWMNILDWLRPGGKKPTLRVIIGLGLGFLGIILLISPKDITGTGVIDLPSTIIILFATISWAAGSLYSRYAQSRASPFLGAGMQMFVGGFVLLIIGTAKGEWNNFNLDSVSPLSVFALLYLIIFGSLIAFSSYIWLLQVSNPVIVSTYAYVNPVVAVFLGWAFADEQVTISTLIAASVIILAVVMITTAKAKKL